MRKERLNAKRREVHDDASSVQIVMPEMNLEWSGSVSTMLERLGISSRGIEWEKAIEPSSTLDNMIHKIVLKMGATKAERSGDKPGNDDLKDGEQHLLRQFMVDRPHTMIVYSRDENPGKEKIVFIATVKQIPQFGESSTRRTDYWPGSRANRFEGETYLSDDGDDDNLKQIDSDDEANFFVIESAIRNPMKV
mmetsp:Transcript_11259/g.17978  ORF Transcript_11259/g.17978 Transcript_11259/m.17978 type:complete len:193 (+) Transcript_11259:1268-1846(+)